MRWCGRRGLGGGDPGRGWRPGRGHGDEGEGVDVVLVGLRGGPAGGGLDWIEIMFF